MNAESARAFQTDYVEDGSGDRVEGRPAEAGRAPVPSLGARFVDGLRSLVWLYGLLVVCGFCALAFNGRVTKSERFTNDELAVTPTSPAQGIAHFTTGSRVRASSYDGYLNGHPLYAIDGEDQWTPSALWVSDPRDRAPWIQIDLAERSEVTSIDIVFDLVPGKASRPYRVLCLQGKQSFDGLASDAPSVPRNRHRLECRDTDSVRVEFGRGSSSVRVREITLGGRPS